MTRFLEERREVLEPLYEREIAEAPTRATPRI